MEEKKRKAKKRNEELRRVDCFKLKQINKNKIKPSAKGKKRSGELSWWGGLSN